MTKKVILAIDGGATKTEVILQAADGTVLFHDEKSGSNYQTVGLRSLGHLFQSIFSAIHNATSEVNVNVAIFALAGIDTEEDKKTVRAVIEKVIEKSRLQVEQLIVENDVECVMHGVLKKMPGILLISGTGSIAYGQSKNGDVLRAGGWGHIGGDEGSGYWIGREMIRTICKMEDGRGRPTLLKERVFKLTGCRTVNELANFRAVHEIARLASVLESCCVEGDREARRIARQAARELALLVTALTRMNNIGSVEENPIYMSGGVLHHCLSVRHEVVRLLLQQYPSCRPDLLPKPPIEYIAKRGVSALGG